MATITSTIEDVVRRLPAGSKRACMLMTADWQFAGKATFNSNGAWSLHWAKGVGGRGALCEMENQKDGKWSRSAYRLTPLGLAVRGQLLASVGTHPKGGDAHAAPAPLSDAVPPAEAADATPTSEEPHD